MWITAESQKFKPRVFLIQAGHTIRAHQLLVNRGYKDVYMLYKWNSWDSIEHARLYIRTHTQAFGAMVIIVEPDRVHKRRKRETKFKQRQTKKQLQMPILLDILRKTWNILHEQCEDIDGYEFREWITTDGTNNTQHFTITKRKEI